MSLTKITTHNTDAKNRLAQQFKGKTLIEALVDAFVDQVQALEDVLFDMLDNRTVETAVGAQLDGIGSIVGEERKGRGDDEYRLGIIARIAINNSQGTFSSLVTIFELITGSTETDLREYFPGYIEILGDNDFSSLDVSYIYDIMDLAAAGGVRVYALGDFDSGEYFCFDGDPDGFGFGDSTDATVGGKFAGLIVP